jgi:hypothetical protein
VLARIGKIPGVGGAEVDGTGSYFLVACVPEAIPAVSDVLGPAAEVVDGAARNEQLAHRRRGEMWFSSENIRALSFLEGRVLAIRMRDAVGDLDDHGALLDALRAEILAALEQAHDTGGRSSSGWFWEEWPAVVSRVMARVALAPAEATRVEAALRGAAPA